MKIFTTIITLLILFFAVACDTEDYSKSTYVAMKLGIYQVKVNATTNVRTASYLTIDSLTAKGIGVDSILYNKKTTSRLIFPLNNLSHQSAFSIRFNNITDTLTIFHTNHNEFLSVELGSIKTYTLDSVKATTHFIDSVKISVQNVNTSTSGKEHIQIYH